MEDAPRERERPQPMSQVVKVARRLRDSLKRQRPDFQESGQNEEEDLTEEDAEWMTQIVGRSLLRFIENAPEALDEEIDRVPPVQRDRDELEIATYRYSLRVWSADIGREILDRVSMKAPSHAREMRELRESRCQGFCRHLSFESDAPERVQDLVLRMILASLGS